MSDQTAESVQAENDAFEAWKKTGARSIDVPYSVITGAVNIVGIFHIENPFENSWTEGICAGAIVGTYRLDRSNGEARLYDPTGALLRLVIVLDINGKELRARLDTRKWDGGWSEGDWVIIWRG